MKGDKEFGACPIARRFEVAPITIFEVNQGNHIQVNNLKRYADLVGNHKKLG